MSCPARADQRLRVVALLTASCWLAGCDGPSVPSLVRGEPTCPDMEQAGVKLKGGLKQPVQLRVLSGNDLIATVVLYGIPESVPQPTRFLLPDGDETYTLEWGQCPNERALTPFDPRDRVAGKGASFDCGAAVVYEKTEHSTRKSQPSTHEIDMVPPPNPACWDPPPKK